MNSSQTCAVSLTPAAPGAIAVIAVVGPRAGEAASAVLRRRRRDEPPDLPDCRPVVCRLVDGGVVIDDVVAVRRSLGGQSIVEIHTHGGVRVVQRTLELLERQGALIGRAEDTPCLWPSGDAIERDVDRTLLGVSSRRMTRWLLAQRRLLPPHLARRASWSDEEAAAFRRRSEIACRLVDGLHVAIVGPPNAGKSTLANRLIGRDRVIASDTPGTTRDWVSETALIRGWPVLLTDTAGIRPTDCAIEAEAIRRGSDKARAADLVVVVLDATLPREELESGIHSATQGLTGVRPVIVVLNKMDLMTHEGARDARPGDPDCADHRQRCRVSAKSGTGIDELELEIEAALGLNLLGEDSPATFMAGQIPS